MSQRVDCAGWRLVLALPNDSETIRDRLVKLILATVDGREVVPMRRSRHAVTFNARLHRDAHAPLSLFVKVLDSPRGFERVKRKLRGTPASHVSRVTSELLAAGFDAPAVWAYGFHVSSGRELIVTPRAAGRGPLRTLAAIDKASKRMLLKALGCEIARLHQASFVHGDLTPFNIFIVEGVRPRFVLLDHERTRRVGTAYGRQQLRNLVQLGRFELPGITRTDRLRLLRSYTSNMSSRQRPRVERKIIGMLERRILRDGGPQRIASLHIASLSHGVVGD